MLSSPLAIILSVAAVLPCQAFLHDVMFVDTTDKCMQDVKSCAYKMPACAHVLCMISNRLNAVHVQRCTCQLAPPYRPGSMCCPGPFAWRAARQERGIHASAAKCPALEQHANVFVLFRPICMVCCPSREGHSCLCSEVPCTGATR